MNFKIFAGHAVGLTVSICLTTACAKQSGLTSREGAPPKYRHLDPEMTAPEMQTFATFSAPTAEPAKQEVSAPLATGKRLYDWLNAINAARAAGQKLSFTNPHTTLAYPIDHPSIYNPTIINADYQKAMAAAPPEMVKVLNETSDLPDTTLGLADDVFIARGLAIARTYDTATRWVLLAPEHDAYVQGQAYDIRGYYFLSRTPGLEYKLNHFASQANAEQMGPWLVGECLNGSSQHFNRQKCEREFARAKNKNAVLAFHKKYVKRAQMVYDHYFSISSDLERQDVTWNATHPELAIIPFLRPSLDAFTKFLASNVEDEFHLNGWQLKIQFTDREANDVSKMEFQPGVLDHVEHSLIVIDQNAPLSEYLTQWAIRHEFGHIMGFVDCYAEFYDEGLQAMVNYQIDTTNLMCSRQGHFKQIHYDTLKAKYFRH